jgi:hypothetical protein
MENEYAVWEAETGRTYFNSTVHYFTEDVEVGKIVNGHKCIMVGTLDECRTFVENAPQPDVGTFADLIDLPEGSAFADLTNPTLTERGRK